MMACLVTEVLAFLKPSPKALSFGGLVLWFVISKYESMIVTWAYKMAFTLVSKLFRATVEAVEAVELDSSTTTPHGATRMCVEVSRVVSRLCRGVCRANVEALSRLCRVFVVELSRPGLKCEPSW